jgi:hypothetical protein
MALGGKGIIIVGSYRSGTSSLSGARARLGVYFGKEADLLKADEHNPAGYFEHRSLNSMHRRLLLSLNLPTAGLDPMPEDWMTRPASSHWLGRYQTLLEAVFTGQDFWGWKDPQASLLLPFVKSALKDFSVHPKLVVCLRNPMAVARSNRARTGTSEIESLGDWIFGTLCALRDSRGMNRRVVQFERLLQDPEGVISSLADWLGLPVSEQSTNEAIASIRSEFARSETNRPDFPKNLPLLRPLYELTGEVSEDALGFEAGQWDDRIESLYEEWLSLRALFYRAPVGEAHLRVGWRRVDQLQYVEKKYSPTRTWEVLRLTPNALPGSQVSVSFFPLPALVWIRKIVWWQGSIPIPTPALPGKDGQLGSEFGLQRVWLHYGAEHILVQVPATKGPFHLEIEFLVESSNLVTGLILKNLSGA